MRTFILAGRAFPHPAALVDAPLHPMDGYDGQFYAALATDPFLANRETLTYLGTLPSYRAGRFGIPLAAWALAAGDARGAILAYELLCWVTALLGVWVAARWLDDEGASPLWAMPLAGTAGVVASMLRALPDAGAAGLMLLALWLRKNDRPGTPWAILLACLVRETSLIAAGALAFCEIRARRYRSAAAMILPSLLALAAWRIWVLSRPGLPGDEHLRVLGAPLVGLLEHVRSGPLPPVELASTVSTVLAIGVAASIWRLADPAALTFAGFAALTACLTDRVTVEVWASARAAVVLPFLATVLAPQARGSGDRWVLRVLPITSTVAGTLLILAAVGLR